LILSLLIGNHEVFPFAENPKTKLAALLLELKTISFVNMKFESIDPSAIKLFLLFAAALQVSLKLSETSEEIVDP
jgi:hypothetical protein